MVIGELLRMVCEAIGSSSESAQLDSKVILKSVTGYDDVHLIVNKNQPVAQEQIIVALEMGKKRADNMPVAYITGVKEFMSLEFEVNPFVLIPRADTECVVEHAINLVKSGNVLDIGCGSGAISVSLAKYVPELSVTALDKSHNAVDVALSNAKRNNVSITGICADIFDFDTDVKYDLIISNPPYIASGDIETLMPDVRNYEPLSALDGGSDGLMFYRRIVDFALEHLNYEGYLLFEFGWKQHDDVVKIITDSGLKFVNTIYDISGIKRGCAAKKI